MSGSTKQPKPTEPVVAGIDMSAEPTNQEAIVAPYVAGQFSVAAKWISPAYNQRAVESPSERPGKK